jgi:hypothetical protein
VNAPFCVANLNSTTIGIYSSATTTINSIVTFGSITNPVINYICL